MKPIINTYMRLSAISFAFASILLETGSATAQADPFAEAKALERKINAAFPTTYQGDRYDLNLTASVNRQGTCRLKIDSRGKHAFSDDLHYSFDGELGENNYLSLTQQGFGPSVITSLDSMTPEGDQSAIWRHQTDGRYSWILRLPIEAGMRPTRKLVSYRHIQRYFRELSKVCGFKFKVEAAG